MKNSYVQALIILIAAAVLAVASNAMAGRTRKLVLVGYYPAALKVPPRVVETPLQAAPAPIVGMESPVSSPAPAVVETATPILPPTAPQKQVVAPAPKPAPAPAKV